MSIKPFDKVPNEDNLRPYLHNMQKCLDKDHLDEDKRKLILNCLHCLKPQIARDSTLTSFYEKLLTRVSDETEFLCTCKGNFLPSDFREIVDQFLPLKSLISFYSVDRARSAQRKERAEDHLKHRKILLSGELFEYTRFFRSTWEHVFWMSHNLEHLVLKDEEELSKGGPASYEMLVASSSAPLKQITMRACSKITTEHFQNYITRAPKITHFTQEDPKCSIEEIGYAMLVRKCPTLSHLEIPITSEVMHILPSLTALTHLKIDHHAHIEQEDLFLLEECHTLTSLNVSGLNLLTAPLMIRLFTTMTQLTHLDISNTEANDLVLATLKESCPRLQRLDVRKTKIPKEAIATLTKERPNLHIAKDRNLTNSHIFALAPFLSFRSLMRLASVDHDCNAQRKKLIKAQLIQREEITNGELSNYSRFFSFSWEHTFQMCTNLQHLILQDDTRAWRGYVNLEMLLASFMVPQLKQITIHTCSLTTMEHFQNFVTECSKYSQKYFPTQKVFRCFSLSHLDIPVTTGVEHRLREMIEFTRPKVDDDADDLILLAV